MLEKVRPGQPFKPSAKMFNTFIDVANAFQQQQQTGGRPQRAALRGATTILVCNNTGADLDRYGVGTIDAPIIGPDDNEDNFLAEPAMSIVEPAAGDGGNVAIVLEPIAKERFGLAVIAGASLVQVSVGDAGHEYAKAKAGDVTQLQSAATADIRILWAETGTGTKWALVRLAGGGSPGLRFGKPTGAYTSGSTIALDPCDSAGTDTGEANVTVQAGWTLPANTNIPTSAIVPYVAVGASSYVLGQPREVVTNIQYDTSSHKLQKKVRYDFGLFSTTESSAWVDITTAVSCTS